MINPCLLAYRLAMLRIEIATIMTSAPLMSNRKALAGAFDHSPVAQPQKLPTMIIVDM
jgi:hypothetical protein